MQNAGSHDKVTYIQINGVYIMKTCYLKTLGDHCERGMYVFTRKVTLAQAEPYQLRIFTTGRYILSINGAYVCEGPCKGHEQVRYYDEITTELLQAGENEIRLTVLHLGQDEFCTVYHHPCPMVLFEAVSRHNRITTDSDWECKRDGKYKFFYLDDQVSLPPGEEVTFGAQDEPCPLEIAGGYRYENGYDFEKGLETFGGVVRAFPLEKRPIPMSVPQDAVELSVIKKGKDFIELDAGK